VVNHVEVSAGTDFKARHGGGLYRRSPMGKVPSLRLFDPGAGVLGTQNLLHALALPGHALRAVLAESDAVPEAAPGEDHLRAVEGEGGVAAVDALGPGDRGQAAAAGPVARHAKPLRGEGPPCAV